MPYQIGFIIEQTLGHITHGQNLQKNLARDPSIQTYWGLPAWQTSGLASKIPVYKSNWTLQTGLQTRRVLTNFKRQARLDALFFHTQVTAVLAQDWMRRIPSIISLDATPRQYDSLGETYAHNRGPEWLEQQKWRLNRDCYRAAKQLVTWSEWTKKGLIDEYQVPAEKITVIPPGVNINEWALSVVGQALNWPTLELPVGRSDSSTDRQTVRILFVGGDLKRKGGQLLLEAFRALRRDTEGRKRKATPAVELHLVTRDIIPPEYGVFVYNHMQPNSPELKALYLNSHIFCLPTYGDCLPMVLSEAGAVGLPLVSTRVAAIPEIVRDDETGLLVPPGDLPALTAALRQLVYDPLLRARMGSCAAALVHREYDAQNNAVRLIDLLKLTATEGLN
jgi:glycosyltransferase involved in cell wall biosynthesis